MIKKNKQINKMKFLSYRGKTTQIMRKIQTDHYNKWKQGSRNNKYKWRYKHYKESINIEETKKDE